MLLCSDIPEADKMIIMTITINHLCEMTESNDIKIVYLFCNYKAQINQSALSLFTAFMKQLIQSQQEITALMTHMYNQHSKQESRSFLNKIFSALQSICSNYIAVHIMMNALNECRNRDDT